jgi:hypothetical protein
LALGDYVRAVSASALAAVALLAAAAPASAGSTPLNVSVASKPKQVLASVTHTPDILSFSVELNGRDITPLFKGSSRGVPRVTLGGSDGLRFGRRNLLVAQVTVPGRSSPVAVTRRFRVKAKHAIASAGPDRTIRAGDAVALDGRGSLARKKRTGKKRPAPKLTWTLVRAPKDSRAALSSPRGKRPSLRTDKSGTYVVKVAARTGPGTNRVDLVRILAVDDSYSGNGLIVSSVNSSGGPDGPADGIRVYSGSGATTYASNGGLVSVAFDETTLEHLGTVTTPSNAPTCGPTYSAVHAPVNNTQRTLGHDVLWLVQGEVPAGDGVPDALCYAKLITEMTGAPTNGPISFSPGEPIAAAGTETFSGGACKPGGLSPIFQAGAGAQQSTWAGCPGYLVLNDVDEDSRLTGTLIRNTDNRFVFMPNYQVTGDLPLIHFDTRAPESTHDQNVMTVGAEVLPSEDLGAAQGGFQVVTIDGRSGKPVNVSNGSNATFATNGPGALAEIQDMHDHLEGIITATTDQNNEQYWLPQNSVVILIQGIGTPAVENLGTATRVHSPQDANDDLRDAWEELGNQVAEFGGTRNGINANPSLWATSAADGAPGYALATSSLYNANGETTFQGITNVPTSEAMGTAPPLHELGPDAYIPIPVRLTGTLRRDPYWQLEPAGSPGAPAREQGDPALADIAMSVPKAGNPQLLPIPFPHQKDPEWIAAAQYAAANTNPSLTYDPTNPGASCYRPPGGVSDIRSNYCGDPKSLLSFMQNFGSLDYPVGQPFSQKTWELMQKQISYEIPIVASVSNRIAAQQSLFQGEKPMVDAQGIAGSINQAVKADLQAKSQTASFVAALLSDAFLIALPMIPDTEDYKDLRFGVEEIGNGLTAGSSILGYGTGGGNAPPFGSLTVAQTTALIDAGLRNAAGALDRIRTLINSDYGKLQAFDQFLRQENHGIAGAGTGIAHAMNVGVAQQAFTVLMSAVYRPVGYPCGTLGENLNLNAQEYACPYNMTLPQHQEDGVPHGCLLRAQPDEVDPDSFFYDDYVGVVPSTSDEFSRAYMLVRGGNRDNAGGLPISDLIPTGTIENAFDSVPISDGAPRPLLSGVPDLGMDHDQWFNQTFGGLRAPGGGMSVYVAGCLG